MNQNSNPIICHHCGTELNDLNAKVNLINESLDLVAKMLSDVNIEEWNPSIRKEYERMMDMMRKLNKL